MNIIPPTFVRPTTCAPAAFLAVLLAVLLPLASACGSAPRENDAADQKAWGTRMAQQGFWREALFRYQRAAALRPDDPQILSNLAVAFEATGEPARALAIYRRALELAPGDERIKRNYARFAEYYTSAQRAAAGTAPTPAAPTLPATPSTAVPK